MRRRSWMLVVVCGLAGGCLPDYELPSNTGSLGGQVLLSGPVRGAVVTVNQLNAHTGKVYQHVGGATTDDLGRFLITETREANGLFRIVARGGTFEDLATGATIQLDDTDELHSLLWFPIVDERGDALVSPIGHLIEAWAWAKLEAIGDMRAAVDDATVHLAKHFGNVEWGLLKPHDLSTPATSPTAPVRAALVHAALSYLAKDIAAAAGASAQQINVYTLLQRWTADLVRLGAVDPAGFDGNDGNDRALGSGLQLGECEPVEPCAAAPVGCSAGHCRTLCDLYVGTPRALLAGAMTKVIRDGKVNRTGLRIEDTLAVARAVSNNIDPLLFGNACVETLDRTRPEVRWDESATPAANAVVGGVVSLKAIGLDDVDLQPRTEIDGYADQDGDSSNNVAIASINTVGGVDGDLIVTARAVDLAGNSAMIERRLIVDNTPPQLTLSPAGFFVDGATWWTADATPTLTGTFIDAHPAAIQASIGATQLPGTFSGEVWSVTLPVGTIDLAGAIVTIRATDRAGNRTELTQRIRHDSSPPALSFQTSTVNDEASEVPTFTAGNIDPALNDIPIHMHGGPTVTLDVVGACPSVTKYSYLLGELAPTYGYEIDSQGNQRRNPIRYQLVTADDGVGVALGSTQYRVGRRASASGTTTWILDWTSTGSGTPTTPGATQYGVGIFSNLVADLATTEGVYDVEFRATDRLSRTTTTARCFTLSLKAPPLYFATGSPAPHTFALDSLSLQSGVPYDLMAARLLNNDATGASLIDQTIYNGTAETVFLTVTVTKPEPTTSPPNAAVTVGQQFQIRNYASITSTYDKCVGPDGDWNPACNQGSGFPSGAYPSSLHTNGANDLLFPVKLYELSSAGVPGIALPCLAPCLASDSTFRFAVPPRAEGGAARRFIAMTMIGQVTLMWPSDTNRPAAAPFEDSVVGGVRYTGKTQFVSSGCWKYNPSMTHCIQRIKRIQYRALTAASLAFATDILSSYSIAPTAQLAPTPVIVRKRDYFLGWSTTEGPLP